MAIELKQQLKLTQQLVMTPQLQQAIKLLQLSQLELVGLVEQELQENPLLEDSTGEEEGEGEPEAPVSREEASASPEEASVSPEEAPADGAAAEASDAQKIDDIDWENYMDAYPQTGMGSASGMDEERRSLEATVTRRPTLADHLEWQLQLSSFTPSEVETARWIIGNLDDDGYLRSTLEEVVRQSGQPLSIVETTLTKVQEFDPAGVASRDLRECLLLQIRSLGVEDPLVGLILDKHLDALQKRDFRGLARTLGAPLEAVAAAARFIGSLEPRPGRGFGGDDPIYITPDIYVYKIGDEFHIVLNEDGLPKLRINRLYRDVLSRGRSVAKDTKEYVQDKVRSALWLIKSIHQRQRTIYRVMESIIRYQGEFFERGVQHLRPLNLRDVAEDIGMHESTVSRVTTNKYAHTPQGIFELKYFFNSSINRVDGDSIASESVKQKIRRIITAEDVARPLSDQRIAEMLKAANIDIARRTVTKYRESMNILSSTRRRQVG
ncbi:MAG: RNA polymerase factor sigma-54 [Myxococcota bacterium]